MEKEKIIYLNKRIYCGILLFKFRINILYLKRERNLYDFFLSVLGDII